LQRGVRTTEGGREGLREGGADEQDVDGTDTGAEGGREEGREKWKGGETVRRSYLAFALFRNVKRRGRKGWLEGGTEGGIEGTYAMYKDNFNPLFAAIRPERGIPTRKAPPVATPWKRPRA